jgi:MHS family proline/betaine transporter-like MFS transporter|tara:strand:- start:95229 stop:96515 length:1287 start_codon:yes stop_codon:yes gene_type:complete
MNLQHKNRIILAGMMGNLVESFDLAICGLLSLHLAKYLHANSAEGLFLVFLSFFAGYLARPFGAVFMGLFSDRYGRKIMMAASIFLMGIATACIGFIPTYSHIGNFALILLFPLRIIQSFACGAEYLNSSAFLVECAAKNRKGFSASWSSFGGTAGLLIATITTLAVVHFSEKYPELEWFIWRVPFMLALVGSSVGLYVRLCMPESLEYVLYYSDHKKPNLSQLTKQSLQYIKHQKVKSALVLALSLLGVSMSFLFYIFGPIQAKLYNNLSYTQILISNLVAACVMLIAYPIIGKLSDTYDRVKILRFSSLALLLLSPYFFQALSGDSLQYLILTQVFVSVPTAAFCAVVPVMLAEMFPLELRCTVLSSLYAVSASVAAGLVPLLAFYLVKQTHNASSPSWIITCLVLFVWGMLMLSQKREASNIVYN